MELIYFNSRWMLWNIFLAILSIILGKLSLKIKPKIFHLFALIIFLLFIPNTIYIVTDLGHFFQQWIRVFGWYRVLLAVQYLIVTPIGFITFVYSLKLLAKNLTQLNKDLGNNFMMILINFLISLGVVVGRVQRANSWEVLTNPIKIFQNTLGTLTSFSLMTYVLVLGLFCNILYFAVKNASVGERT